MESSSILTADVLDIIFEGRNKSYGAYELRKDYNRRLRVSIIVTFSLVAVLITGYVWAGTASNGSKKMIEVEEVKLTKIDPVVKEEPVLPPPPKQKEPPPPVKQLQSTPPRIVRDQDVKPDEMPPPVDQLENAKIGLVNQDGDIDKGIVAPPVDTKGTGVIELPKKADEDEDKVFLKVEIESKYPGGQAAWERFLKKNFHIPQEAIDNEIKGTVMVQFIVDKEGNVSEVEAIDGPVELRAEAIRVIKKSGKWEPAVQNKSTVKSYKRQPISINYVNE